jgi:hypothetical protein
MLENCLSGSEGGGAIALPTPITVSAVSRLTCKNSILSRVSAAPLATTPPVQCRIGFQPVSVSQRGSFDLPVKPTSKCPNSRPGTKCQGWSLDILNRISGRCAQSCQSDGRGRIQKINEFARLSLHFEPELADDVQTRGAFGISAPFGQRQIGL